MHVTFRRVITQNARYDDRFLALGKPTLGAEPCPRLRRGWRHAEERGDTDGEGDGPFDEEEVSPAGLAMKTLKMECSEGDERGNDVANVAGNPEPCETNGKFMLRVEVYGES
jgi:hypothetical protein